MAPSAHRSGIPPLGDVLPGTHLCHFYETADDFIRTVVPYLAAGLDGNELCMWLYTEPVSESQARAAMHQGVPDLDRYLERGLMRFECAADWLLTNGALNQPYFTRAWEELIAGVKQRGLAGLRIAGCVACLPGLQWADISRYEQDLNESLAGKPMIALCSYSLATTEAAGVLDVARTHQYALAKRAGEWEVVETPAMRLKQLAARNRQESAIADLGLMAVRGSSIDVLMNEAVSLAAQILGTGLGMIWQVRPEQNDLVLRSRIGWDALPADATVPMDDGSVAQWIYSNDQPLVVSELQSDPRFEKSWIMRDYRIASIVTAIIRGRGRPWGAVSVHSMTTRSFSDDDLRFVESLANLLALAIERDEHEAERRRGEEERERLLATTEAALAKLHAIESITDATLGHMGLDDLLKELLARLRSALQTDLSGVMLFDEVQKQLIVRAIDGVPISRFAKTGLRVPSVSPIWSRLTNEPRPVILDDALAGATPEWREWVTNLLGKIGSAMGVPLVVEEKLIGTVVAGSKTYRAFTSDELDLLRVVADRVAPAIERARLLETVRAGRERLETLSRRLLAVQEEERRRVAIELHDELGQVLTAVKINLESIPTQVGVAVESVERAMQTTRDLALDLRPAMLDDLGLAAALRWYADRFAKQTQIVMHLAIEEISDLPPTLATACFRVTQEALTNVTRHASAKNVWLEVRRTARGLELVVRDDGVGFEVDAARDRATQGASLGLLGMEERVTLAGGSIDIRSTPETGTEIRALFPMRSDA